MDDKLTNLVSLINDYQDQVVSADELEQYTLDLITDSDFGKMDKELQDIIYTLDNKELNELTSEDIKLIKLRFQILTNF